MPRHSPYISQQHFSNTNANLGNLLIAAAYILSLIGFYSLAPLITIISSNDEGLISIGLRAIVLGGTLTLLLVAKAPKNIGTGYSIAPLVIFLLAFSFRAYHNIYIENLQVYISPQILYSYLFGASLIPALMAARLGARIQDRHFAVIVALSSVLFLVGLSLNLDALVLGENKARIYIQRMNPIAMTSMAFDFCLFYFIFFGHSKATKLLAVIVVPLCIIIAVYSKSRGPILGAVFAMVVYFLLTNTKHRRSVIQATTALFITAIIVNYVFGINLLSTLIERFYQGGSGNNYLSVSIRQTQWAAAWQGFLDDPLVGRYIFEQASYFYPHNLPLESLMSLGFVGGVLYLASMFFSFKACFTILKSRMANKTAIFSALLFLKYFGQSMFSGSIWASSTLWISAAFIIAYANYLRK